TPAKWPRLESVRDPAAIAINTPGSTLPRPFIPVHPWAGQRKRNRDSDSDAESNAQGGIVQGDAERCTDGHADRHANAELGGHLAVDAPVHPIRLPMNRTPEPGRAAKRLRLK